jgi:HSP20 family protein
MGSVKEYGEVSEPNYSNDGTFQRSFTLQQYIQPNLIKATFKDGVLEIEIPKPDEEQPKQITVKVE